MAKFVGTHSNMIREREMERDRVREREKQVGERRVRGERDKARER